MAFLHSTADSPDQPAFRQDLVAVLRALEAPAAWVGLTAITWAKTFSPELAVRLALAGYVDLDRRLSREELRKFCARHDVPLEFRVAAVMAWGRSNPRNRGHNRKLWASVPNIANLLQRLPGMTRKQAFAEFQQLVATGALQGMRASFFTKLMFFFGCPCAYILDQWTAKAMLALCAMNWRIDVDGRPTYLEAPGNFVRLGYGGTSIAKSMTEGHYEKYCSALESLVEPLGRSDGADVERWLFSAPKSVWRQFLKSLNWDLRPEPVY